MAKKNIKKEDKFIFWMPCDIEKAKKDTDSQPEMRLKGIASTLERDSDGEILDPEGFELDFFLTSGMVNWHHQSKDKPLANIGEPEVAKLVPDGLYVECLLYSDSQLANDVFGLAQLLEKNSKTRRLGFSIEGKVLERDPMDESRITKARITGLAVTHIPKNPATLCEIMKGERDGFDMEWDEEEIEDIETKRKKKKVVEEDEETEKALDSVSGAALKKESLDGAPKPNIQEQDEEEPQLKTLSKGEVFSKIFLDFPDIALSKSKQVYRVIEKISENMNNGKTIITDSAISKAYEILGIPSEEGEINKGEDATSFGNGGGRTEDARTRGGSTTYYREMEKAGEYEKMTKGEAEDGSEDEKADDKIYVKKGEDFVEKGEDNAEQSADDTVEKGEEGGEKPTASATEDKTKTDDVEKGVSNDIGGEVKKTEDLFKAFASELQKSNAEMFKAVGTILQSVSENQTKIMARLEEYEQEPAQGRKSIQNVNQIERFAKGEDNGALGGGKTISLTAERGKVIGLLNSVTFAKGEMNQFYANGLTTYEASGNMPDNVRQALEAEKGVKFVD